MLPAPKELLTMRPISTQVNNVRNKGEDLVAEIDPDADAPAGDGSGGDAASEPAS